MLKNSFFKTFTFLLFVVLFSSCDKEFSVVGDDIIKNPSFGIVKEELPVVAYNQKLGPIQSNDMAINSLGIYDNPSFGTTKANFVTQVSLELLNLTFDGSATVKSVVLSVPYFYDKTKTVLNTDGSSTYVLDSIYGPSLAKMKLSVYESGYFMRDLDPEDQFTQFQKYYTNQYADFFSVKKGSPLNDSTTNPAENSEFFFDPSEHVTISTDGKETKTRSAPGMQLNLNTTFFQEKILNAAPNLLTSNTLFKDYFRGLVFDIQNNGSDPGNLALIDFTKGSITITYTETINSVATDKTMILKLSGHTANFLDQSNTNVNYANATNPSNIDPIKGDSSLYLKGGEGSLSILKLFGDDNYGDDGVTGVPNGVADQLDILRTNKSLINQAELTVYLNSTAMGTSYIQQRLYLYDFTNNLVLADYLDGSSATNPKNDKYIFGGILAKETDAQGGRYFYKFRITEHVRTLVKNSELTNVDLGLVVTENINLPSFYFLRDKTGFPLKAPLASVMNPLGTIIYGNNIPVGSDNYDQRMKFEIYYTKVN
jgi:hypothetical protein